MIGVFWFVLAVLTSPLKSRLRLEAENAALRRQLMVLRRRLQGRVRLANQGSRVKKFFRDQLFFLSVSRGSRERSSALMARQSPLLGPR
jgi:hypothetical protein